MHRKLSFTWFSSVPRLPFFYGWIIVAVAVLAQLVAGFGHPYVATVFIESIRVELGWSLTLLSSMYTAGSALAATLMLIMGRLLDRYGSRIMLTLICFFMGLVTMSMSRVGHPAHLLAGFALIRLLGESSLGLVSLTLVSIWFIRFRGRATSLASIGLATAHSALPIVTHLLITLYGWRNAWIGLGLIIWAVLLLPALLLSRRSPESVGLLPDGIAPATLQPGKGPQPAADEENDFTLVEAMRTRTLWLLLVCGISLPLILTGILFHHVPLMQTKGVGPQLAATALLLWGPCMVIGNLIGGVVADRIPIRYSLAGVQVLLAAILLWTRMITAPWQAFVYIFMAGTCVGLNFTSFAVIWADYFGRRHLGAIRGLVSTSMLFFSAIGALPFGVIFDMTGSYDRALLILLALPLISGAAALFAVAPRKGHPKSKVCPAT